ncbi:MAG: outer membrane protein transport protein [Alphaproteobacteria bacterium]|nr:outer membrane protein transport protein [Alphaproteobacteria bacterium]
MRQNGSSASLAAIAVVAAMAGSFPAWATDGYFQPGFGARQKALGGAGVADGRDATSTSLNPAGLVHSPSEYTTAISLFSPQRYVEGSGQPGFTSTGRVESDSKLFFIPNMAWAQRVNSSLVDVIGVSMYANGGMNTDYRGVARPLLECGGGSGVFCGGRAGVNLQQALLSVNFAKEVMPGFAIGIAPILGRQQFEAEGVSLLTPNSSTDVSWGGGVKGGIEWSVMPNVRIGVAATSPIWMQPFDKYSNLFAEQGDFDIPANVVAGIAIDVMPNLTFMADYKHIWYSEVAAIANPSANAFIAPFGADNGPGFGWEDVDVIKVGLEWRASQQYTLRAGYSYNTSPLRSEDVMFNILAPAAVQHHISAGATYKLSDRIDIEVAGMYVPESSISGVELNPPLGNPNHNVEIGMEQFDITFGFKYRLD